MKLSLPPKLVEKLVGVPVISFCKIFIHSYAFDGLLSQNRPFSPLNSLTLLMITYIKGCRGRNEAFHPSICPVIHPQMASLQPMWLRFCCTRRNGHIIQQRLFFWFRQLATKKNPVQPLGRNLKKELPEHSLYFLEKKEKKRKNSPDLDSESVQLAQIQAGLQKKLYCPPRTVAI